MTRSRPHQNAFSSGEIDPLLHAREDFQRHQTGLARCPGFLPLRQGGFTRAPGTIYRGRTRDDLRARRIPFAFNANDALVLEFTHLAMRVWRYGVLVEQSPGVPFKLITPYEEDDLRNLQVAQDKDVIYIVDGRQPMQKLSRLALDDWTIAPVSHETGPFRIQNLDEDKTVYCTQDTGTTTVIGQNMGFDASWVGTLLKIETTDVTSGNLKIWKAEGNASNGDLIFYDDRIYEFISGADMGREPPLHEYGTRRLSDGGLFKFISDMVGVVRITAVTDADTATAEVLKRVPITCILEPGNPPTTNATYRWAEGAWSEKYGYPKCIEIDDDQSLWAAATTSEPRTLWKSVAGDLEDFTAGGDADDGFAYTIASSGTYNGIRWLKRGRRGLYVGAEGEAVVIYAPQASQVIGPTNINVDLVAASGVAEALPISPQGFPAAIEIGGTRFLEYRYSLEQDGARPIELSLPSQHLGAQRFRQVVWQGGPMRLGWIRTEAGELVAIIYDPEEDVLGWAPVSVAGGVVEDMDVSKTPDGAASVVTLTVRRTINGATVRCIEEMPDLQPFLIGATDDVPCHFFCGVQVNTGGGLITSLSLPHLAGEQIHGETEAGGFGPVTVPGDGIVNLPDAVNWAVAGLFDDTHFAETLDLRVAAPDGDTRGRLKQLLPDTGITVHRTQNARIAPVSLWPSQAQTIVGHATELMPVAALDQSTDLHSGPIATSVQTGVAEAVRIRFIPDGGKSMTILSVTPSVEDEGP